MYFKKATSGDNHVMWYLLGVFVVVAGYILGQIPLVFVQFMKVSSDKSITTEEVDEFYETMDFSLLNMNSNLGLVLMIMVFVFALLALLIALKYFHKRPLLNTITPRSKVDYKKIFFGFGIWFLLALIFEGFLAFLNPESYYLNFNWVEWIVLFVIYLTLLPIQTTFEELFLRGYLMPAFGLLFHNKWMPLIVTSILFGLIHGMNPEVERFGFWIMMTYYIGAGLFLGLITILDDSLELAIGVHAATNIFGAAFFSFDGSVLQTASIVKSSEVNPQLMSMTFLISAVVFILICNYKYQWNGLKRLFQPIHKEVFEEENAIS